MSDTETEKAQIKRNSERRWADWNKEQALKNEVEALSRLNDFVNQAVAYVIRGKLVELIPERHTIAIADYGSDAVLSKEQYDHFARYLEIALHSDYIRCWQQDGSVFYQLSSAYERHDGHAEYIAHRRHIEFK